MSWKKKEKLTHRSKPLKKSPKKSYFTQVQLRQRAQKVMTEVNCYIKALLTGLSKIVTRCFKPTVKLLILLATLVSVFNVGGFVCSQVKNLVKNHQPAVQVITTPVPEELQSYDRIEQQLADFKNYINFLEVKLEQMQNTTESREQFFFKQIEELKNSRCDDEKPDKTGLADYALESVGGEIISEWTSRGLMTTYPLLKVWDVPLFYQTLSPRLAIQPQVNPGNCFGYNGNQGSIGIKLSRDVLVSAVSIEHIPKELAPNQDVSSAPRNMTIFGHESGDKFNDLASIEYSTSGPTVQTFRFSNKVYYNRIKLNVNSNWGNDDYTCIYRIRVHGNV